MTHTPVDRGPPIQKIGSRTLEFARPLIRPIPVLDPPHGSYEFPTPLPPQSDARDLMVKPDQPRGARLHRPGGGVGGHPGTVPPSRLLYGSAARSQAKRR